MSGTIKLKRSAVALKVPATTDFAVGELALNTYDGKVYLRGNNGADFVQLVGAPTAGALRRSILWSTGSGNAPIEDYTYAQRCFKFAQGLSQSLVAWIEVPAGYQAATQINLKLPFFSPGTSNNVLFHTVTTLIRKNTDAITSTTNQYTSTNTQSTLSVANQYIQETLDITAGAGTINSVAVNPGDLLQIVLTRVAPSGTEDTNDISVIADGCEILFS